ncbi:MAG: hydantoinase B/oxoprolinase family protein [Burkholderiaceae bacterium]
MLMNSALDVDTAELDKLGMDPVSFEVLRNALTNVTEEMALTIRRSAYSTNIKTRADFSCAFFDNKLRCVAQSFAQPAHLVSMATIAPAAILEYGIDSWGPGDAILVNDPHRGASHLNDVACISPVFCGGERVGFLANMAHHVDVGGSSPASLGINRELFQEGVILPPTRIASGGRIDHNVLRLILSNIRAPRETNGDLRAQLSANVVGARRMQGVVDRFSAEVLTRFCDALIAYTERWARRDLASLPQGVYRAEAYRDDDGFSDEPVKLVVAVEIRDGRMSIDLTGSDRQRASPMNCTRAMSRCALAFVARCLVSPELPVNSGFLSQLDVTGPDGLVCTAVHPAAVVGGWEIGQKLAELIWLALHPAMPERVPASGKALIFNLGFGGYNFRRDEYFCYMETVAGGGGARPNMDGASAVQTNLHNTENAPVEEVEMNYPIRIARYELIPDSGGRGRHRGGLGVRRDFEFPYDECTFTIMSDGRKFAPWGLAGGESGRCARYILDPLGEARELPSKVTVTVPKGGRVRIETPGGGGFGDPAGRDPELAANDVRNGYVSPPRSC